MSIWDKDEPASKDSTSVPSNAKSEGQKPAGKAKATKSKSPSKLEQFMGGIGEMNGEIARFIKWMKAGGPGPRESMQQGQINQAINHPSQFQSHAMGLLMCFREYLEMDK